MSIRLLRPIDVVGLASFDRRYGDAELTSHTWPQVEPDSARMSLVRLASSALAQPVLGRRVWIARSGRVVQGYAVARPRAGGLVWDVEHLHAAPDADGLAVALLERVTAHAAASGARRVFLQMLPQPHALVVARRAGFERFTTSTLYLLPAHWSAERADSFPARPRLRADDQALFQLYCAAAPARVRSAEAMTLEEWSALYRGARPWKPGLVGSRQQYVWELGTTLVGWMEIHFGDRSQWVELLVHPRYEEATDRLLRYALSQISPKAAVYVAAREYQPTLASSLKCAGFREVASHELFVRLLAVRVARPVLATASLAGH